MHIDELNRIRGEHPYEPDVLQLCNTVEALQNEVTDMAKKLAVRGNNQEWSSLIARAHKKHVNIVREYLKVHDVLTLQAYDDIYELLLRPVHRSARQEYHDLLAESEQECGKLSRRCKWLEGELERCTRIGGV